MRETNAPWLKELLADHEPPCVSLYQPVHRASPPADEDPVRFRNLLQETEQTLRNRYPHDLTRELVQKVRSAEPEFTPLGGDRDAIAVFASTDYFQVVHLQRPVDQGVVIADNFHVKPLIRLLQMAGRFQVLCLTQQQVDMYEGTWYRLDKLPLRHVPQNADIVTGMRLSEQIPSAVDLLEARTQVPNEGTTPQPPAPIERFFRAVDKAVWENYSRLSRLPLILAAVERHQPLFHAISGNPCLLEEGIRLDPKNVGRDRLRQEAWRIMEPRYRAELTRLTDQFRVARAHHLGSDQLFQVAEAAASGRIGTLLVQSDRQIPGRLHRASGLIEPLDIARPYANDVLDDLAELVLQKDGQVLIVPPEQMPTDAGLAAIYRY